LLPQGVETGDRFGDVGLRLLDRLGRNDGPRREVTDDVAEAHDRRCVCRWVAFGIESLDQHAAICGRHLDPRAHRERLIRRIGCVAPGRHRRGAGIERIEQGLSRNGVEAVDVDIE
jgi:hypothetical protein